MTPRPWSIDETLAHSFAGIAGCHRAGAVPAGELQVCRLLHAALLVPLSRLRSCYPAGPPFDRFQAPTSPFVTCYEIAERATAPSR